MILRSFVIGILVLSVNILSGQEKIYPYQDGLSMEEFMDYCSFLPLTESSEIKVPPEEADFIPFEIMEFDSVGNTYWMKFSIENQNPFRVQFMLFPGLSERLDFYDPVGETYSVLKIGANEPRNEVRKISGGGRTFYSKVRLELDAHETKTYYAFFERSATGKQAKRDARLSPRIISLELWNAQLAKSNVIWFFMFGCCLIMMLYHIVYYFMTRDQVYLYYSLFVISFSLPLLTLVLDVTNLQHFSIVIFFSLFGFFSVLYFQMLRKLIDLKAYLPRWDKILRNYNVFKTVLVIIYCLVYLATRDVFVILTFFGLPFFIEAIIMIILMVVLLRLKDRVATLFVIGSLIAWIGLIIGVIIADPETTFTTQMKPFTHSTPVIGLILESLFFAMVLAYRARLNEIEKKEAKDALIGQLQENKELQEKVNRELENKVKERTSLIEVERQKSEQLLLNLLPETIAMELKETGTTIPKRFDEVTVLFADFVGFTKISARMNPEVLVKHLDFYFKKFDGIMEQYELEKIKTIGDAYMSVCGLPEQVEGNVIKTVDAALAMQQFLMQRNFDESISGANWQLRIGIHTGAVVAGVIGDYKFAYDVWGDTVNTASRLEQHSAGGKINVSEAVYNIIKEDFICQKRGKVEVKNKGIIDMYFVEGRRVKKK